MSCGLWWNGSRPRLVAAGGTAPRRVGLLASRSLTAYVGYLAILRTGAAVVPLGPDFPPARNAAMAAAAGLDLAVGDTPGAGDGLGVPLLVASAEELADPRSGEETNGWVKPRYPSGLCA